MTQSPTIEAATVMAKVKKAHAGAGEVLATLPEPLVRHLGKVFHESKPLAIAILATVNKESPESLAMQFKVPVRWVLRLRDSCLRALRQREVQLWAPPEKPGNVQTPQGTPP